MFVGIKPSLGAYSAGVFTMIDEFSAGGGESHRGAGEERWGVRAWAGP